MVNENADERRGRDVKARRARSRWDKLTTESAAETNGEAGRGGEGLVSERNEGSNNV